MKTMRTKISLLAGLVLALATSPLYAATIDFSSGVGTDLGTLTYAGGATPLVGANILIGAVTGVGTPSNASVTDAISGGILSFTTGNFVSYNALTQTYIFGSGGSITISGTGPGCLTVGGCGGNTPNTTSGPTLLTGVNLAAQYLDGAFNLYITDGFDRKDPKLVQFFGIDPALNPIWSFSGSVHATLTSGGGGGAFTAASNHSTDISNSVPEPASILLIGAGLLGFGLLLRRKQIQSVN
jgi:hypothetical protein